MPKLKNCRANRHIYKCKDGYIVEIPRITTQWLKDDGGDIKCFEKLDDAREARNKAYKLSTR